MQITVSDHRAPGFAGEAGTARALLLGARLAGHDIFGLCCRLVGRTGRGMHLDQVAAAGLRRAWHAEGTLALLSAGWHIVLMLETAARIAAEPARYASLARVLSFAARSAGARVALVQPPLGATPDGLAVEATVQAAADGAHAEIVPVGAAWRLALARRPGLPLTESDGRLTALGAYLVACTLSHYVAGPTLHPLELPGVAARDIGLAHRAAQQSLRASHTPPRRMDQGSR